MLYGPRDVGFQHGTLQVNWRALLVSERGEEAVAHVRKLTGGFGVHSMATAVGITRPGGVVGRVGVPHYHEIPSSDLVFFNNITIGGDPAPVRAYIQELLPDVLEGRIDPGRVFDRTIGLTDVPDGYRAMERSKSCGALILKRNICRSANVSFKRLIAKEMT